MTAFDQWIAPMPIASSASAMPRPMKRLLWRMSTICPLSIERVFLVCHGASVSYVSADIHKCPISSTSP
jgi:hypothetical protein